MTTVNDLTLQECIGHHAGLAHEITRDFCAHTYSYDHSRRWERDMHWRFMREINSLRESHRELLMLAQKLLADEVSLSDALAAIHEQEGKYPAEKAPCLLDVIPAVQLPAEVDLEVADA